MINHAAFSGQTRSRIFGLLGVVLAWLMTGSAGFCLLAMSLRPVPGAAQAVGLEVVAPDPAPSATIEGSTVEGKEEPSSPTEGPVITLPPMVVTARRPLTAFSDQIIRDQDFLNLPRQTPSDLMRMVPGIFLSQHTGGGKAHQFFLRGFDAEHGQDLAGYLDGIPLNEVSHVHGQGYLDLHFLIPETLTRMQVIRGPYLAEYGNLAVAGAVNFVTRSSRDQSSLTGAYGSFDTYRGLAQFSREWKGRWMYLALEAADTRGFTDPGRFTAYRGFSSWFVPLGEAGQVRLITAHYYGEYDAADVIPVAWIENGRLDRFDAVDKSDGGESSRHLVGLTYSREKENSWLELQGFYNERRSVIFSNYTYYYFNPVLGDQYELLDQRRYGGLNASAGWSRKVKSVPFETKIGLQFRQDGVHQVQANTRERDRFNVLTDYDFLESSLGVYLREQVWPWPWLQLTPGIRYDRVWYDVDGAQDTQVFDIYTNQMVTVQDLPVDTRTWAEIWSPKISVVLSPLTRPRGQVDGLDLFFNYGEGFFTARAPQAANYPDHDIPRAISYETAFRVYLFERKLNLGAGVWWADKEAELVFEPETGISIPRGQSRRRGEEFEVRYSPLEWLYLSADFFHTQAKFRASGDDIPGTPEWMSNQAVSLRHPSGLRGSLRGRYLGERPLLNHDHSRAYYLVDFLAGYERKRWGVELAMDNLFDVEWDDTSFSYTSRPEPGGADYTGVHITPGTPQAFRLSLTVNF